MRTRRFPSRQEAERYLTEQGFEFLGAPSRWRKTMAGHASYADVVVQSGTAVVVFTESSDGLPS
ncbi:hypothetical protein [Azospirillum sp. TSO22-1]|uniref:hypothetical protein n=1 Tax=Azospirillum sp. TSO22-1 TaxID=716789 RepID=UPI000D620CFF|nr:hypothetical protein [Azospirillum sp. TSO22-1]PWC56228.1 hypothetical protein TSO221_02425 [Azospirillum sp. TSO22-1]